MNKTVAIVGKAQKTRGFAPYDDLSVDMWGYQDFVFKHMLRVTGMFEMHPDCLTTDRYTQAYQDWLRQPHDFPIWMHEPIAEIPASVKYPRDEVNSMLMHNVWKGEKKVENYYTSSTPYAIALAIWMGYKRIEIYGVELSTADGYMEERDCVYFWMGKASALGVYIVVHAGSGLLDNKLYPFVL